MSVCLSLCRLQRVNDALAWIRQRTPPLATITSCWFLTICHTYICCDWNRKTTCNWLTTTVKLVVIDGTNGPRAHILTTSRTFHIRPAPVTRCFSHVNPPGSRSNRASSLVSRWRLLAWNLFVGDLAAWCEDWGKNPVRWLCGVDQGNYDEETADERRRQHARVDDTTGRSLNDIVAGRHRLNKAAKKRDAPVSQPQQQEHCIRDPITLDYITQIIYSQILNEALYRKHCTLSSKKGSHQTFGNNFSNLNRFSKFFHCWIEDEYFQQNCVIFSTTP